MEIKVRGLTGRTYELEVETDEQISKVKDKVAEKVGVPASQQRLIYGGKQLADDKTLTDYQIIAGCMLHLVLALRGGC